MKRCVQCQSDLPDTAVHCVYCGAKQPAVAAAKAVAAASRTVMGYPGLPPRSMPPRGIGSPLPTGVIGKSVRPGPGGSAADRVSGFDATQPLSAETIRGPGPGLGSSPAGAAAGSQSQPLPGVGAPPRTPLHSHGPPRQETGLHGDGPPGQAFRAGPGAGRGSGDQKVPGFEPPSDHGFTPPGMPPGYPPPVRAVAAEPHGQGPPPAGSMLKSMQAPAMPPPIPHGPGPLAFGPPDTGLAPAAHVQSLTSRGGQRPAVPMEPWGESLRTLMLVFGVLLLACFVAPWRVQPGETTFAWTILGSDVPAAAKAVPVVFLATGVIAVVLGALPLTALTRGFAAAGIGLAPIAYLALEPAFGWQQLLGLVGAVMLIAGLLVRSQYTGGLIGRFMATVGALCVIAPLVVPVGHAVPLLAFLRAIADASFEGKVAGIVRLAPALLALLSFLVWLPPPGRARAHVLAWLLIAWPAVGAIAVWLVNGNLVATLKNSLDAVLYMPLAAMAWAALAGHGVAAVAGKQAEAV